MHNTAIRLAIVDDEQLIVKLLEAFFRAKENIEVVSTAYSGEQFLEQLPKLESLPDVLLLDLRMKKIDGVEVTTTLRTQYPGIRVIVISSYYKQSFTGYMLKTGVSAFLPKGILPEQLYQIVQTVHQTGHYFLSEQIETMRTQVSPKVPKPRFSVEETITEREREILQLICQQYTAQEIADKLFIAKRTVEGHKNKLLAKANVKNTAGLIIYAIQKQLIDINTLNLL